MAVQAIPCDAETFGADFLIATGSKGIPIFTPTPPTNKDDEQESLCRRETLIVHPHCIFPIRSTLLIEEGRNSRLPREVPHEFRF